jgi:transcriptional regulator PpsR
MTNLTIAQPDVELFLSAEGVIEKAVLANTVRDESGEAWVGRAWVDTIADFGADKVLRMLAHARSSGVAAFRQITQRFPSGRELPMEYTTIRLGDGGGLIAVGKNLQAVAELQSRLIAAQQAMEQDHWKLRDVETRYRLLFEVSDEAVVMLRADNMKIAEANPAALRALGLTSQRRNGAIGRDLLGLIAKTDQASVQAMLHRVREDGKSPRAVVHLGDEQRAWSVRASFMTSDAAQPVFLLQLTPVVSAELPYDSNEPAVSVEELIELGPDGFVVLSDDGTILRANRAFVKLIQLSDERSVLGQPLGRWLGRPGADLTVLLANVQRQGQVRLFSTQILGELGSDTDVEISAFGHGSSDANCIGVLIRDVGSRLPSPQGENRLGTTLGSLAEQIGKTPLRKLVRDTVGVVERHYIDAALELTEGNRTAAAEILGLSRQSLYAKLSRYDIDGGAVAESSRRG